MLPAASLGNGILGDFNFLPSIGGFSVFILLGASIKSVLEKNDMCNNMKTANLGVQVNTPYVSSSISSF